MLPAEGSVAPLGQRERRIAVLRAASVHKQQDAVGRAEKALRQLIKHGDPINFRAVARAGEVSVNFLYTSHELRARIEQLRAQQNGARKPSPDPGPAASRSVIRALTAKLGVERQQHHKETAELRAALAAAQGELPVLRRSVTPNSAS